jgi:hypothetical protein
MHQVPSAMRTSVTLLSMQPGERTGSAARNNSHWYNSCLSHYVAATKPATQSPEDELQVPQPALAFLLSTLGWHSHALWSERLSRLQLDVRQAAVLLHVAAAEGKPQQVVVRALRIPASRVVALEAEYRMYGLPFPPAAVRLEQLDEAIQVCKSLWAKGTI